MPEVAKYQMVFWDFDGTLADSQHDVWDSLRHAVGKLGGEFTNGFDQDPLNLALPMEEILQAVVPYPGSSELDLFGELVADHYRNVNRFPRTVLYPGIMDILRDLRTAGSRQHIVTLKPSVALGRLLSSKGWTQEFDGWDSPDSLDGPTRNKAAMVADVIDLEQVENRACVLVGDSLGDWEAARSNGLDFVGVTYGDGDLDVHVAPGKATLVHTTSALREALMERG